MSDRIEIIIDLVNGAKAVKSLQEILGLEKDISSLKPTIDVNIAESTNKIKTLQNAISDITNKAHQVRIDMQINGASAADIRKAMLPYEQAILDYRKQITGIRENLNTLQYDRSILGAASSQLKLQEKQLIQAQKEDAAFRKEYEQYYEKVWQDLLDRRDQEEARRASEAAWWGNALAERDAEWEQRNAYLRKSANYIQLDERTKQLYSELGEENEAYYHNLENLSAIREYQNTIRPMEQANAIMLDANSISAILGGAAAVSSGTSVFSSGIAESFGQIGSMFQTDIARTATRYMTAMATRAVKGYIDNSLARADIMNTFLPYMAIAGVDTETAKSALNRIDLSIRGLPIGLDEAAQRLRRYQMFMDDVESATNMTIGIQKAITAGGASEAMKTQAYYQIDRLLSAGKLATSRQWLSLLQGLGVSTRFLAAEMGDAGMTAKEMAAGLTSGQISTEDFLKAIQQLATNTTLDEALNVYKGTYESWMSNIRFAQVRGGTKVLDTLSETLDIATGQTTIDYMRNFRDSLNDIYAGISGWVSKNPQFVSQGVEAIQDIIGAFSGIDYGRIGSGTISNIGRLVESITTALSKVSGGKLEDFISFATTLAGPASAGLGASSGLGALLGVFDRFKDFDFTGLVNDLSGAVGSMANLVSGLLSVVPDGLMSKGLAYGAVYGRPVSAALNFAATAVPSIASGIAAYKILTAGLADPTTASFALSGGLSAGLQNAAFGLLGLTGLAAVGTGIYATHYFNQQDQQNRISSAQQAYNAAGIQALIENSAANGRYLEYATNEATEAAMQTGDLKQMSDQMLANGEAIQKNREEYDKLYKQREQALSRLEIAQRNREDLVNKRNRAQTKWEAEEYNKQILQADANIKVLNDEIDGLSSQMVENSRRTKRLSETNNDLQRSYSKVSKEANEAAKAVKEAEEAEEEAAEKAEITRLDIAKERNAVGGYNLWQTSSTAAEALGEKRPGFDGSPIEYKVVVSDLIEGLQANAENDRIFAEDLKKLNALSKKYRIGGELGKISAKDANAVMDMVSQAIEGGDYDTVHALANATPEEIEAMISEYNTAADAIERANYQMGQLSATAGGFIPQAEEVANNLATVAAQGGYAAHGLDGVAKATSDAGGATDGASPKLAALSGNLDEVAGSAGAAASELSTTAAIIDKLQSKHIQVVIDIIQNEKINHAYGDIANDALARARGAGSSNRQEGNIDIPFSRGGIVYAANGMFIPHGTDTVPAMLTPGEYVVRRKAAAAFGKAFMDRVNALDIHGVFRALSHRMNVPSTGSFIANNQRTYDNHASVTQNIVTNSQSFTHRRARRWVRALT